MKRLMPIAVLALAPLGCVANQGDAPIRFLGVRALEFEEGVGCSAAEGLVISAGSLDLSGGQNYLMAPSVETNTFQQPITIGQEPFSGEGLGDITLNEIIYSYEVQPVSEGASVVLPAAEEDRVATYSVFRPETDPDESYKFMYAFGPKGLAALRRDLQPGQVVTVLSTIQARGRLSGGQEVRSNKFTFPITVYVSGYAYPCTGDEIPTGTCRIPGQDSTGCYDPDAT